MDTVALVGAAGKMGSRLARRLKESADYRLLNIVRSETAAARLRERGDVATEKSAALPQADYVILSVPDTRIGEIATEMVPQLKPGAMLICLDPAAPHAGKLPKRDDVSYFITHPAHPPILKDEDDPAARRDYFGDGRAKQAIVNTLIQGPETDYARGEALARVLWGPVLRSHRVSLEQMAYLEPVLSEMIAQTCVDVIREAVDEAARRGVPHEAARDFVLGHLGILVAVYFDEVESEISDAAKKMLGVSRDRLIAPDWRRLFEPEEVMNSCLQIVGDRPVSAEGPAGSGEPSP